MCQHAKRVRTRAPTARPEFTLGTIRKAIPPHCFERSLLRSSLCLAADVVLVSLMFWASAFIKQAPAPLPWLLWPLYWFFQGAVMTGIWVISHGRRCCVPFSFYILQFHHCIYYRQLHTNTAWP